MDKIVIERRKTEPVCSFIDCTLTPMVRCEECRLPLCLMHVKDSKCKFLKLFWCKKVCIPCYKEWKE